MTLSSPKLGRLNLPAKPFAFGGAGEVYRATANDGAEYCVKILTKPKFGEFDKLAYMVGQPPGVITSGWGKLCWPIDLVYKQRVAEPVGYVMPLAIEDSVELSNLTNLRWPGGERPELAVKVDRKSPQGLSNRMVVSINIAAAIKHIHAMGHVFVDLKPQNILISPNGEVSVVDLDSLQIKVGNTVYRGPLGSPEYMPSESYQMDFGVGPPVEQSWDRFALAVVIYEILLGIHPYTGALKPSALDCPTIADSIRRRMYVHGVNRSQFQVIPPPHDGVSKLHPQVVSLFSKAFESPQPAGRPTAADWGQALYLATKQAGSSPPTPAVQTSGRPTPSLKIENCWGPWGKNCPHELRGVFKRGLPNAVARGGLSVYFCDDCLPGR